MKVVKKIISFAFVFTLMFALAGCDNPFQKKIESDETTKKETITSIKAQGSMKGITLKVGVSPDFAPFTVQNEQTKEMEGFDIDILEAVSKELGFEYVLVVEPIRDIEADLEKGNIDCAISGISITDSRSEKFKFTDTYFKNTLSLIVNDSVQAESRKDIVHMKLGAETGSSSYEYLVKYMKKNNNKVRGYKSMSNVFRALENGKIDAAIEDTTAVEYYLKNHPDSKILSLESSLYDEQSNYGIMCKSSFKYIDELNVGLKEIDLNGEYQKIYDKWFREASEE